jgi:hypothetical protein
VVVAGDGLVKRDLPFVVAPGQRQRLGAALDRRRMPSGVARTRKPAALCSGRLPLWLVSSTVPLVDVVSDDILPRNWWEDWVMTSDE